jgi:hypothetical protein
MTVTPEMLVNAVFRFATPSQKQTLVGELTRPKGGSGPSIFDDLTLLVEQHSARLPDRKGFYSGRPQVPATIFLAAQSARALPVKTIGETDVGSTIKSESGTGRFAATAAHLGAVMQQHGMDESGSDRLSQMMRVWQDLRAE